MVNYFKHHYGFQFISASRKCRPIKVCKHLCDTSVTGVVAGHIMCMHSTDRHFFFNINEHVLTTHKNDSL